MGVMNGCEDNKKTAILKEVECPVCKEEIEVFAKRGKAVEDSVCECGYTIKQGDAV